jgi:hypothetical protein
MCRSLAVMCAKCPLPPVAMLEDIRDTYIARMSKKATVLQGYESSLTDLQSKTRYEEKLCLIGGIDPYEVDLEHWKDYVATWPGITHIHLAMYLLFPFTGKDLMNRRKQQKKVKI